MMPFYWQLTEYTGLVLSAVTLYFLYPRVQLWPAITLLYCVIRGLGAFSPWPLFTDPMVGLVVARSELQAVASLLIVSGAVLHCPSYIFKRWPHGLIALGLLNLGPYLWFGYGIFQAGTFDAGFFAACLPFSGIWAYPFFLTGILSSQGATAILMVAGEAGAYLWAKGKRVWSLVFVAAILGAGFVLQGWELVSSTGRLQGWGQALSWWWKQGHWVFGIGLGSYQGLAPFLPTLPGGEVLYQLHNDWLQILFELGFFGLFFSLALFCRLLWMSRSRPHLFSLVMGLGIFGATYHPLRFFVSQLLVACVIRTVYDLESKS